MVYGTSQLHPKFASVANEFIVSNLLFCKRWNIEGLFATRNSSPEIFFALIPETPGQD